MIRLDDAIKGMSLAIILAINHDQIGNSIVQPYAQSSWRHDVERVPSSGQRVSMRFAITICDVVGELR